MVVNKKVDSILRDCARNKHAYNQLVDLFEEAAGDQRLRAFMQSPIDSIFVLDSEGAILDLNEVTAQRLNDSYENLLGKNIFDYFSPDLAESRRAIFNRVVNERQPVTFEDERNGIHFHTLLYPVMLENDDIAVSGIGRDITAHDQARDKHITDEVARVEAQQAEHTRKLQYSMMSRITHEFRQPLSVILTSAHMLDRYMDRLTPEKRRARFQQIDAQVHYIDHLLREMSSVIEAQYDHEPVALQPVDVMVLVHGMVASLKANERVNVTYDGAEKTFISDPDRLENIITHLISNAIKYSGPDSVIQVIVHQSSHEITILVADDGIGIRETDAPHIFEPFYRGSNFDERPGMGLGLAKVQDAVSALSGTISFDSTENAGTTFRVKLPRLSMSMES